MKTAKRHDLHLRQSGGRLRVNLRKQFRTRSRLEQVLPQARLTESATEGACLTSSMLQTSQNSTGDLLDLEMTLFDKDLGWNSHFDEFIRKCAVKSNPPNQGFMLSGTVDFIRSPQLDSRIAKRAEVTS
jgi:hypothetical protein